MRTAIIGGGIAGLAAAFELEQARQTGAAVEYTLFEARERLGGCLASEIVGGAVLERGPDSFLSEKPAAAALCRELGLASELTPSNDADRKTYIVVRNRLIPLPDGLMFLVPTKLIPTALTRLFSLSDQDAHGPGTAPSAAPQRSGRVGGRAGRAPLWPGDRRPAGRSAALRHLWRRRRATERPRRAAAPGGDGEPIRLADPRNAGRPPQDAVWPRPPSKQQRQRSCQRPALSSPPCAAECSSWWTPWPRGIDPASVRLSTPVSSLEKTADGWQVTAAGKTEFYDAVIVASPAWAAAELLTPVDAALGAELSAIPYSSSITVNLVYDESRLGRLPDGFGFLVPAVEGRAMLACTFVHRKFLGRTPPGKAVLRAFLGGMRNEALIAASDEALVATVRRELSEILGESVVGLSVEPEHAQVSRWSRAMAQYAVGHPERKQRIAERVAALPGLRLAGNAYDGIGIPDCIRLGRQAAKELAA